ncbi:MAG: Hsp20/alpha crystallin family protein [Usitatibacter sp.]
MYPSLTRFSGDLFAEFDGLQRQMEQLLGLRGMPSSIRAASRGAFPAINMGTTADAVEIYAFAPGIDPAKLEVSVDKGLLTIAGERLGEVPEPSDTVSIYANERFDGTFKRVVSLPEDADTTRVDAVYRNGVLKVAIPMREQSKPRRIEVQQ